ncbi:zinc finger CCCH domain-containing protein 62-like [Amaranthus tricolor]|uniref:zinc finger CCCH domain-containing protein 62-like n=1 Tax=Amaranthus tricolor TaxID=29722 RepID=UPI00258D36BE|nr:zinc finger CCCH domain-containing protein 62-like [Amaranthus tricolor]
MAMKTIAATIHLHFQECESIHDEEDDVYELDDDVSDENDFSDDGCIGADYDDNQSLSNRVIHFLQGKHDLQELSLIACKSYLRRHDLRVSGNKDECIRRVQEHWSFDKVTRKGKLLGKRTIAGRVVKESYGAAKQQHTFTIRAYY